MIIIPFFLNTLEEYYIGELYLPIVHGVSEGMILIAITECLSGFFGPSLWKTKITLFSSSYQLNNLLGVAGLTAGVIFGIVSLVKIGRFLGSKFTDMFKTCRIFILIVSSFLSLIFLNDTNCYMIVNCPKLVILTYGILFAKVMGLMQLAHLKGDLFKPLYFTILFPLITLLVHSVLYYLGIRLIPVDYLIGFFFIWNVTSWAHFVYYCSEEMCEILNIHRFILGKRHLDKSK